MVTVKSMSYYMTIGLIFGTVTTSIISIAITKIRKPMYAYVINAIVQVIMLTILFFYQNLCFNQWNNISKWIIILVAQEIFSCLIIGYWYRKRSWYNSRLENKKNDLRKETSNVSLEGK